MNGSAIDVMMLCEWPSLNGGEHSMLAVLELLSPQGGRAAGHPVLPHPAENPLPLVAGISAEETPDSGALVQGGRAAGQPVLPHPGEHPLPLVAGIPVLGTTEISAGAARSPVPVALGLRIAAAAPSAGPLAEALHQRGIEVLPFDWRTADGQRLPQGVLRERLARLLADRRPRLLHANSLSAAVMAGPVVAASGRPGIGHLRDIVTLSRQAIDDLSRLDRLIAVSHATRQFHLAQGLAADKITVIYNGVDLDRFRPRPRSGRLHAELGLPDDAVLLGAVGQLGMRKGWEVILQAMTLCRADGPPIHLAAVGEHHSHKPEADLYVNRLRQFAIERLPGRVHFLGRRDDVAELLPELTLLVHAARQEPLGRVLLEAAAAGCAIVATDVGGTREIFPVDSGAACLVPADDPAALALAIDRLVRSPDERQSLRSAARARAERRFDRRRAAREILGEYRRWLA